MKTASVQAKVFQSLSLSGKTGEVSVPGSKVTPLTSLSNASIRSWRPSCFARKSATSQRNPTNSSMSLFLLLLLVSHGSKSLIEFSDCLDLIVA